MNKLSKKQKSIVILDTNFLFVPFYFKIDIFSELEFLLPGKKEFIVPSTVLEELQRIKVAKPVIKYLELHRDKFRIVNVPGKGADSSIVTLVKILRRQEPGAKIYVATGDKDLRRILSGLGTRLIYVRSRKKLVIDE